MNLTEKQITGTVARQLREALKLTQTAFWAPLGVKQSVGCRYESDVAIPQAVRILIVATYIAGLKLDAKTPEGLAELIRLAVMQSKFTEAKKAAGNASRDLGNAATSIGIARAVLAGI